MVRCFVEVGVRFVMVHYDCVDGYSWDFYCSSQHLEKYLISMFD